MTRVAILSVPAKGGPAYHAVAGEKHSQGSTAGQALDALEAQLPAEDTGTIVVVQNLRPDRYFNAVQQKRLAELMAQWRDARDRGAALPDDTQAELNGLIDAELRASASRSAAAAAETGL